MKRNLLLLLFLFLVGALFGVNAQYVTIDGLEYNLNLDTHEAVLYRGNTWVGELIIPSSLNYEGQEYIVTSLNPFSFHSDAALTSVTIPGSVTVIGECSFIDCINLKNVIISEGVRTIDYRAFSGCRNLSSITIPRSVTWISYSVFEETPWYNNQPDGLVYAGRIAYKYKGNVPEKTHITITEGTCAIAKGAFKECRGLISVTIPEGLTKIAEDAFYGCSDLVSVIIPKTLSCIEDGCFNGCNSLKSIVIPESVERIGIAAFQNCTSLSTVNIPEGFTSIYNYTFNNCSNLTAINIPKSVTRIGDKVFSNTSLESVTIPKNVTYIGISAFEGCGKLTNVYIPRRIAPNTGKDVFKDSNIASATLHVPASSIEQYKTTLPWSNFGNFVGLTPASIEINEYNFPDENFRSWLLAQEYGDDGVLTDAEIVTVKKIKVNDKNIQNLKGIEYFTELLRLECNNNQLTTLDISECTQLLRLQCKNNQLTSLDVSQNTALIELQCDGNQLASINVVGCTSLTSLSCSNNKLSALNVSGCESLSSLFCSNNQLRELNISDTQLLRLECFQNQIKGAAMDALVESLPSLFGRLHVIFYENEQNIMTTKQVEMALAKNWMSYYNPDGRVWRRYEGSEPKEFVSFTKDQMATIILPTTPDAEKGKYYKLDRSEKNQIIFTAEINPQARVPYIIIPNEDFSVELSEDIDGLQRDTVSTKDVLFIGLYHREELSFQEDYYIDIIDITPDCKVPENNSEQFIIGALRSYLKVTWDDPYGQGPTRGVTRKKAIVLEDNPNSIAEMKNESEKYDDAIYDLSGRRLSGKPAKGLYIQNGKKVARP
ncbi:MAG: leucine-rich repeat protein [Bacteroidaceae bacterium]|nr:leucine-rich repeat protein [Bacteroidaceae bacterium]